MNRKKFFRKFPAAVGFSCLLFVVLYAYAKNPDCKKFKDGKFKVVMKELGMTFYIVREGTRQAEISDGEQDSAFFVVKWIDDCTYTLVPTKETWKKKYSFLPEDNVLTIKIFRTTDSSYFQQSTSNFADLVDTSEVIILH